MNDDGRFIGSDPNAASLLPGLPPEEWTLPVREFFARMEGPVALENGTRFNAPPIMALNLELANAWLDFNQHVSSDRMDLPTTVREVAILRIAWHMRAGYEWYQHRIIGRRCGLSDDKIDAVGDGADAPVWNEEERLAIRLADEIHAQDRASPELLRELIACFGPRQMLELFWSIGAYGMLAWIFNSLEVPIEDFAKS